MSLRVLIAGGRDYADYERVFATLDRFREKFGVALVIHGAARGADTLADKWATSRVLPCLRVPADWERWGSGVAGPARNALMLQLGVPDRVLAFPGGAGTADMVTRARAAGVEVREIPPRKAAP